MNNSVAVVFDYYQTLVDAEPATLDTFSNLLKTLDIDLTLKRFLARREQQVRGRPAHGPYEGAAAPFRTFEQTWLEDGEELLSPFGVVGGGRLFADARFEAHLEATPYPDTTAALDLLRSAGFTVAVLSDADRNYLRGNITRHKLQFTCLLCSEDIRCYKPHINAFYAIAQELGIPPHKCIYVGDNPAVDVEGARRAGMKGVWIDRNSRMWPPALSKPQLQGSTLLDLARDLLIQS